MKYLSRNVISEKMIRVTWNSSQDWLEYRNPSNPAILIKTTVYLSVRYIRLLKYTVSLRFPNLFFMFRGKSTDIDVEMRKSKLRFDLNSTVISKDFDFSLCSIIRSIKFVKLVINSMDQISTEKIGRC